MALASTLKRAEDEIENGRLWRAKEILSSSISTYGYEPALFEPMLNWCFNWEIEWKLDAFFCLVRSLQLRMSGRRNLESGYRDGLYFVGGLFDHLRSFRDATALGAFLWVIVKRVVIAVEESRQLGRGVRNRLEVLAAKPKNRRLVSAGASTSQWRGCLL